ncbi:hypothetical protein FB45DRAFT_934589 [Roridomyces roridus]|uniref:Stealth protein CR1 conserved region 1 domain-containing protein n=1 Tax=Roridomyces roridus TaxID=1738132 RepID=A0AAD7BCB2_9AGAR|nr:hypothetical protein FB45DRAFT_934589 [Roridomyces roridus]
MIPAHRPASAYPNRKGGRPLQLLFLRRRRCGLALVFLLILIFWIVHLTKDRPPRWQPVYHPFDLPAAEEAVADTRVRSISAQTALSDECVEQWIAKGAWGGACRVEESKIDLIYTWVNGSDPLHRKARKAAVDAQVRKGSMKKPREARFREHDELRYSLRSIRKATALWKQTAIHLVSADVDPKDTSNSNTRLGLLPQWFNLNFTPPRSDNGAPPVYLHHDSELFRLIPNGPGRPSVEAIHEWRNKTLPTFNSHAIESQLPNLDPSFVSENIITLNDDNFLLLDLPPSAYHSPLYGPVFLFQTDRYIASDDTGTLDGTSETRSLSWSNHLLDKRFGARRRPYIMHNARAFSLPLLHESSLAFAPYFSATPYSQFRGSHSVPREIEVNMMFTGTNWVVERHREALLWSWVVGKWGGGNEMVSEGTKDAMWTELGGEKGVDELKVLWPERATRIEIASRMREAGIREPWVEGGVNRTQPRDQYAFVSGDGYVHAYLPLVPDTPTHQFIPDFAVLSKSVACQMSRAACLGSGEQSAWDLFRRVLVEKPRCGDCFISALVRASGREGLEIFLPPPNSAASSSEEAEILPLVLPHAAPPLPQNPRRFATRLIYRYSYALGVSLTKFIMMGSSMQVPGELRRVDADPNIALLCINDDLPEWGRGGGYADQLLKQWWEKRWPDKGEWEL